MSATRLPPQAPPVTDADVRAGCVALRHAQSAARHGGVFASAVPGGWLAGPCVVLVGHDVLAVATGEARAALSSEQGWSQLLGTRFGRAVVNADDPQHARDRRRWASAFAQAALARNLASIRALAEERVARWAAGPMLDVYPAAREFAFAAIGTTLGGFPDDARLARARELFTLVLDPPLAGESELDRHVRVAPLRDELEALLRRQMAQPGCPDAGHRLADHLHRHDPALGDDDLLAHLNLLLVTGHETTASVLTFALHHAAQPRWSTWLREELDLSDAGADVPLETLEALPRLDAFVREAGRMYPALMCAPRVSTSDIVIGDVRIPAGSRVMLSYGGTNMLAAVYADPVSFAPGRWFDAALPRAATFGAGHRLCLGVRFAQLEMKAVLAHVLTRYDVQREDNPAPVNVGFWNTRPAGRVRIALRPRAPRH